MVCFLFYTRQEEIALFTDMAVVTVQGPCFDVQYFLAK